jgi:pimeloyl-ACP methyl ester carboxylesterase
MLVVAVYSSYRRDIAEARQKALAGSQLLDTPCGVIEYATVGHGPPVLALHGTGGGWDQGISAFQGLASRGFQIIAPSRFGYLRTALPTDPSPPNEADTWACFLDALNIRRASVIGVSAGAAPAVQFALRHPQRTTALILLVPAAGGLAPDPAVGPPSFVMNVMLRFDFVFWAAMRVAPTTMLNLVGTPAALVRTLSPHDKAELDGTIERILPVSQRRLGIINDATTQSTTAPYALERVAVPTLLISAEDDLYLTLPNARRAAGIIPGARLIEFKTGGHLLLGRWAEVWPVVADFVRH